MRFYQLFIDGKPYLQLNEDNKEAPRITFNLKQVDEGSDTPNNIICIYNVGPSFFGRLDKFIGKKVELYGGIKLSPLLKTLGVSEVKTNLLAMGYIAEINANPVERFVENKVMIVLRASAEVSDKPFLLELKEGDNLKQKLKQALNGIYSNCIVEIAGLQKLATKKEKIKIYRYSDIRNEAKKNGISIFKTSKGFLITDPEPSENPRIIKVKAQDLLEIPSQIRFSTLSVSFALRGDISIHSILHFTSKTFASITADTKLLLAQPKFYVEGKYYVTKIWHLGDSREKGVQSWATNVEAVKMEGSK